MVINRENGVGNQRSVSCSKALRVTNYSGTV